MSVEIDGVNNIIKTDTISEVTSANGVTIDGLTIKDGNIIGDVALAGTTPTFTIGDAGAEDASLIFDGNQVDFVMGVDDSADEFRIGVGTALGSDRVFEINSSGVSTFQKAVNFAGSAPTVTVGDGGAEDAKIIFDGNEQNFYIGLDDSTNKLTIGLGNSLGTFPGFTMDENTAVEFPDNTVTIISSGNHDMLTLRSTDADAAVGPVFVLHRDSASPADNDILGNIIFSGDDSAGNETDFIRFDVAASDRLNGAEDGQFRIMGMLAGSEQEFIRLNPNGFTFNEGGANLNFRIEGDTDINNFFVDAGNNRIGIGQGSPGAKLDVDSSDTSQIAGMFTASSASFGGDGITRIVCTRANTTAYEFMRVISGGTADVEYILRGDGNAFADGAWNGGGADYAEYFEWKDGNSSDEDRRGYPVILDDNKIVKATDSDDASKIIGIISGNPAMVGDGAYTKWNDKYQKDDFGSYLRDENGYRILNTNYDETKDYVPRENRKEWDTVGLMGKLRLRKGQPTGTNWIKMRDISDTVEEWLVR